MVAEHSTWTAGKSDDLALISELPNDLRELIQESGGFILHDGAIHFRGCVLEPDWNSLREAWRGTNALHLLYPDVYTTDIPFAQDQLGDQYLLRDGSVLRLEAETGEVALFANNLQAFTSGIGNSISEYLNVGLGYKLEPGFLLHASPPFCMAESGVKTSLRPIPIAELIRFHAEVAKQIRDVPDGWKVAFSIQP